MYDNIYGGLVPSELWRHFARLNQIPRPSGREEAARDYAMEVADAYGLQSFVDGQGNLYISVPKSDQGRGDSEPIAIQCHLDMVCEKDAGVAHDFASNPIQPRREGDWI